MPYTLKSLVLVWLAIFGLFAVVASGVVPARMPWLLAVVLGALGAPFVILRDPRDAALAMQSGAPTQETPSRPPRLAFDAV